MAMRLLGIAAARQLRSALAFRPPQQLEAQCLKRLLHFKISDKDAGLEEQRLANQQTLAESRAPQESRVRDSPNAEVFEYEASSRKNKGGGRKTGGKKSAIAEQAESTGSDANIFGNAKINDDDAMKDEDDDEDNEPNRRAKKLRSIQYARLIKDHLNAKQLKEAINVLEQRILKEDRVKPDAYIYNLLISGCAKAGYTRKAFSLFTKMRQRGLPAKGGTYTSLFNACANAPSPADGLGRAQRLREIMVEKGYEPNVMNYNAMIKAYGRCGDVSTAYQLADEMLERNLPVNSDTFNFLLQACASDKEMGFRHCLLTWHKMLQRHCQPDYYTFNLVLRCTRDCGFGNLPAMHQLLQQILKDRPVLSIRAGGEAAVEQSQQHVDSDNSTTSTELSSLAELQEMSVDDDVATVQLTSDATQLEVPNLLAPQPHLGSMISLAEVTKAHDRFLLLGGLNGFLDLMKQYKITPDIQTFTTMLEVIPPTNAAEKQVLIFIRKIGLKADIDFFNILIKKRSMRFDYEGAKEVLSMIRTTGLQPDIVTYGVLALGCTAVDEARELLQQMDQQGVRMNIQILGAMLRQGCAQKVFPYVNEIMQISLDENIKPNDVFLRHLHNFYTQCARAIDARHHSTKTKEFKRAHAKFCDKLRFYQEEQGVAGLKLDDAIKKMKERPYEHYKEATIDGIEPLKNEKLARKQKLRKYIKKIKIDSLRDSDDGSTPSDDAAGGSAGSEPQRKLNPFTTSAEQLN